MSTRLQHSIIRASAGSGKTYQLANRYIALLLLQAMADQMAPGKLVAITFTRKGAGEFAERILRRLAKGAGDEAERRRLQADLRQLVSGNPERGTAGLASRPEGLSDEGKISPHPNPLPIGWGEGATPVGPSRVNQTLRQCGLAPGVQLDIDEATLQQALAVMVDEFDRLVLGTIDSFMSRSVQTLAFELGLDGFEILEEPAAQRAQQELLEEVFQAASETDLEAFYQTLKLATFKSASSLQRELKGFVDQYHKLIHTLPEAPAWGGTAFWNGLVPAAPGREWQKEAFALREQVALQDFGHKGVTTSLVTTLEWLAQRQPGTSAGKPPSWLDQAGKLQELWANWPQQDWQFDYYKKLRTIPASVMAPLKSILAGWLAAESVALADKTKAIYDIVSQYERLYDQQARRKGRLAFDDLPLLLDAANGSEAAQTAIELLAFRWFQQFDHWMLDEFQDTSRVQWGVLKPWLDEAIQDDSGTKSVFVVGDPKQSIYGWRGGEPRLFDDLSRSYPGTFQEQIMAESWRSRPAVLDLVNRVCDPGKNPALQAPASFCASALARWRYDAHLPEPSRASRPGYAALLRAPEVEATETDGAAEGTGPGGEVSDKLAAQARVIKAVLDQVEPLKKGLSCAILVRKNDNAQAIAQWLRAHGLLNVMVEGDATLADQSPVVAALVDALRWLENPAHTLAGGHILATPLWDVLQKPLLGKAASQVAPGSVWKYWRTRVSQNGAGEITREWCRQLLLVARDAYSQYCLRQVDQFAHQTGPALALPDWLFSLEQLKVRETATAGSIHVMTIHKAKGLGFDVVFLPDLDLGGGGGDDVLVRRDEEGRAVGCLVCPPKWLRSWVPMLEEYKAAQEADQDLEALCVLYVALTRAKEATFVVLKKESPKRASRARDWLLRGLTNAADEAGLQPFPSPWSEGELLWQQGAPEFAAGKPAAAPSEAALEPVSQLLAPLSRRERRRPSDAGHGAIEPQSVAVATGDRGQEFGSAVHKVFEQIEWWDAGMQLRGSQSAVATVRSCLEVPEIRALFTPETVRDEAHRELPLELLEKDLWWSGIVDRLVLRYDVNGNLGKALLIDFKTDSVESAEALRSCYAEQLAIYRRAVALALQMSETLVETVLVSTQTRSLLKL